MSAFLLGVPAVFSLGKERTPWEVKVVLSTWWLYSCCAIHRSVPRKHGSQKLDFRFTAFSEVRMLEILRTSPLKNSANFAFWGFSEVRGWGQPYQKLIKNSLRVVTCGAKFIADSSVILILHPGKVRE
jgi:hypothetical protein